MNANDLSRDMTKPVWSESSLCVQWVAKDPRFLQADSLGIRPVWSESSLCAQWVAKDPRFLQADSEDSDQTGRMPRLIWIFAARTAILLVLSCRGSLVTNAAVKYQLVQNRCKMIWASPWDYGTYHICDQRRLRRASRSLARALTVRTHKLGK